MTPFPEPFQDEAGPMKSYDCGCQVRWNYETGKPEIHACRLHNAAGALLVACSELVRGIDDWNSAVGKIIDCSKLPKWEGLEAARAAITAAQPVVTEMAQEDS